MLNWQEVFDIVNFLRGFITFCVNSSQNNGRFLFISSITRVVWLRWQKKWDVRFMIIYLTVIQTHVWHGSSQSSQFPVIVSPCSAQCTILGVLNWLYRLNYRLEGEGGGGCTMPVRAPSLTHVTTSVVVGDLMWPLQVCWLLTGLDQEKHNAPPPPPPPPPPSPPPPGLPSQCKRWGWPEKSIKCPSSDSAVSVSVFGLVLTTLLSPPGCYIWIALLLTPNL